MLLNTFFAYWSPETLELRMSIAMELLEGATALQDPALVFWAHVLQFDVTLETGELERAQLALQQLRRRRTSSVSRH